jgi:hypothetical protein
LIVADKIKILDNVEPGIGLGDDDALTAYLLLSAKDMECFPDESARCGHDEPRFRVNSFQVTILAMEH